MNANAEFKIAVVDVDVKITRTSPHAVCCVGVDGCSGPSWFPLALVEISKSDDGTHDILTAPRWLLNKEGFL
jgi:hypothetical protein